MKQNMLPTYNKFQQHYLYSVASTSSSTNQLGGSDDDDNEDEDNKATDEYDVTSKSTTTTSIQRRRRVRRKENEPNIDDIGVVTSTTPEVMVSIPIMDVRNLVDTTTTTITSDEDLSQQKQSNKSIDTRNMLKEENGDESIISRVENFHSTNEIEVAYDPLEQLLLDVKEMRSLNDKSITQLENTSKNEDGSILPSISFSKILSTIVILDFFIVLVFFVWFLFGIVASYTIKDDTIQIAFNSNFQTFVQPALGILMIASISDAIFKEKEE